MSEYLQRRLLLMRLIPRQPRKKSAPELYEELTERGIETTQRTVERDLESLSALMPLVRDERSRPYGWSWTTDAPLLDLPAIDPETALTLRVMDAHASALLPPNARHRLIPYMERAETVLEQTVDNVGLRTWPDRVRVLGGGPPLQPPALTPEVFETVQHGVLERRCLDVHYRSRSRGAVTKSYRIHPLALVFREPVSYLVATIGPYRDPRHLALHRILHAELADEPAEDPEGGFDLDAFIAQGAFDYPEGDEVTLQLRLDDGTAFHLSEAPLAGDQSLTPLDDEGCLYELHATVQYTARLRWWLLGLGSAVQVLAPESLRRDIAGEIQRLAELYEVPSSG